LLREGRRALHARIADILERRFAEIAERQPELLARHCAEAGQIEKAARLRGKAGQQSLERSALVEAIEQMSRALALIATLPETTALRREQLGLQVALITPLGHVTVTSRELPLRKPGRRPSGQGCSSSRRRRLARPPMIRFCRLPPCTGSG
jgi:hypothetical protein